MSAVVFLTLGTILSLNAQQGRGRIFFIAVAAALSVLVGVSRLYLGVNFPTDVLAGWCLGTAWSILCAVVYLTLSRRRPNQPSRSEE